MQLAVLPKEMWYCFVIGRRKVVWGCGMTKKMKSDGWRQKEWRRQKSFVGT